MTVTVGYCRILFIRFTSTWRSIFPNMHLNVYFFWASQAFLLLIFRTNKMMMMIAWRSWYFGSYTLFRVIFYKALLMFLFHRHVDEISNHKLWIWFLDPIVLISRSIEWRLLQLLLLLLIHYLLAIADINFARSQNLLGIQVSGGGSGIMIRALLGHCNHRSMVVLGEILRLWWISRRNSMCGNGIEHKEVVPFILWRHRWYYIIIDVILRRFAWIANKACPKQRCEHLISAPSARHYSLISWL